MKKLTEILPDVFVVEVPKDAENFGIYDVLLHAGKYQICYANFGLPKLVLEVDVNKPEFEHFKNAEIEILGYCTKDEISFDVSEFNDAENEPINIPKRDYKIFPGGKKAAQKFNEEQWQQFSQQSFRSLLLKHGFDSYKKLVVLKKVTT